VIKKKQLIENLYSALDSEEEANSQFYDYTIKSLKYYKWLSEEKKEKVQNIIAKLRDDTQRHKNVIEKLIQEIKMSNKDVF
jgi:molecular chaperone DnaK (HSP70)